MCVLYIRGYKCKLWWLMSCVSAAKYFSGYNLVCPDGVLHIMYINEQNSCRPILRLFEIKIVLKFSMIRWKCLSGNVIDKSITGFPCSLDNSGKWLFHGKTGKSQERCQVPQGILENSEIAGNSQRIFIMADLSAASAKCCIVFHMLYTQALKTPSLMESYIHFQFTNYTSFLLR